MIVNQGKISLLNSQLSYLAGLEWGLFTNNQATTPGTNDSITFAALTEATWSGYARVTVGTMGAPSIVANSAVSLPSAQPSFGNSDSVTHSFYGWFLYDGSASTLVAAQNVGSTSIAAGGNYPLAASVTDNDIGG